MHLHCSYLGSGLVVINRYFHKIDSTFRYREISWVWSDRISLGSSPDWYLIKYVCIFRHFGLFPVIFIHNGSSNLVVINRYFQKKQKFPFFLNLSILTFFKQKSWLKLKILSTGSIEPFKLKNGPDFVKKKYAFSEHLRGDSQHCVTVGKMTTFWLIEN